MTKTERLLRELIALPSVNPAFLPERHPHAGEKQVAQFLAATAATAGLDVELQPVLPGRANVLARLRPTANPRHRVVLAPHLDTVDAAEEEFQPRIHDGKLYGRGACDTKGSVAAMLQALCETAKTKKRPAHTEILFIGLIDEEHAQAGSRAVAASGLKAELAIVGEPTRGQVITAHKGSLWLELATRGKAAHGSRPELGRNAVHSMARVVDLLQTRYAAQLRRKRHPLLGHATVSVGAIAGGSQPNIVPDECRIQVDRRTLPGETGWSVRKDLAVLLRRAGLQASVNDLKAASCDPLETDPKLPFVSRFLACNRQSKPVGADYFCDAAVLSAGGIPSVVFGPGDIAQAHTAQEWVSLKSLERAREILSRFLLSLP